MVSYRDHILYVCIAKEGEILAKYSKEDELRPIAQKCIQNTPPYHSMFSHTWSRRTYTFLIDDPFAYFAIFDENLERHEGLRLLNLLKNSFLEMINSGLIRDLDNPGSSYSIQSQFDLVLRELGVLDNGFESHNLSGSVQGDSRNPSLDSVNGGNIYKAPLLGSPGKGLKKKKRFNGEVLNGDHRDIILESKVDVVDEGSGLCRDIALSNQKNGGVSFGERQKAKQAWKKQVWIVLLLDLFVCVVLFCVWLWVCKGFKCIDG